MRRLIRPAAAEAPEIPAGTETASLNLELDGDAFTAARVTGYR